MAETEETDKGNFGRKILSFFLKDEPAVAPAPGSVAVKSVGASPAPAPPTAVNVPGAPGQVDTKFVDHFTAVLNKTNLAGPDYFEFREILKNLGNLGLSEEKQYQAAWASFKAMAGSADAAILTNTANQYLTALNADRDAFRQSAETTLAEKVGNLQQEQQQLQTDKEALAKQITELQAKLTATTERLANIGGELNEQSAKINQNRANYEATHTHFVDQIKADITKVGSYLN